jgi:hypothetical protein
MRCLPAMTGCTSVFVWVQAAAAFVAKRPSPVPAGDANATAMTDIHDIKPALSMGPDLHWLYWALAAVAVLVLAVLAWQLWRRRKKPPAAEDAAPPIPAETEAYGLLDALAAEGGLDPKQFYFRLSAILRRYIERRFEVPAAEMTTEELLPTVDRLSLGPQLSQPLKAFCRATDPIKFAGAGADAHHMAQDMAFVRNFVRTTTEITPAAMADEAGKQRSGPLDELALAELPLNGENK